MRTLTILSFLQILFFVSFAQERNGKIDGMVKDGDGKVLDAVTVSILKHTDSSLVKIALTDKSGAFTFDHIAAGKYFLSVTHVGYENWYGSPFELTNISSVISHIDISLRTSNHSLGTVTVTSKRPLVENRIDKTIVNVDASATNGGLTALEILEKSPGVMVDNDGNVSLKGKQGVIIMIDGKPTYLNSQDLTNYLKNMPSNQLDQVEIMSQPPAKYDASGNSGVINLITKKNKNAGFNGSLTTSAIIAKYFKNTNSFNFNWHKGKINFYGTYGFSYWEGFNEINIDKSLRENANTDFDRYSSQYTFGRYSDRVRHSVQALISLRTEKILLGSPSTARSTRKVLLLHLRPIFMTVCISLFNTILRNRKIKHHRLTWASMPTGLTNWMIRAASCLSMLIIYSIIRRARPTSNNYLFNADNIPSEDPYLLSGLLPSMIDIYSIKSDYKKILNKDITLEAGIKSSYVKTDNDAGYSLFNSDIQKWESDTSISNHFIYEENINAAYLNWQQKINKLSIQLGLRAEQTNSIGNQTVKNVNFKRNYFDLFPTAFFTYKRDDNNTFGLSFGRRIERPSYESLNPFRFQLDRYDYQLGNPDLLPQFSNNVELSYNYKGVWNISANYTMTTDVISDVLITVKEPNDSNYTTYLTTQNVASQRNIGLSINYSKQITPAWTLNVFFNLYNNHYKGVIDSTNVDAGFTSFNANFNTQYSFKKGWTGELSGFYYAKDYVSSVILADGRGMFSLGASKQILKGKGSIKLNLRDPLYLMSFTGYTNLDKGLTRAHYVWDNRRMIFTFTYRFGKSTSNQSQRRSNGASDEQNRVGGKNGQQ